MATVGNTGSPSVNSDFGTHAGTMVAGFYTMPSPGGTLTDIHVYCRTDTGSSHAGYVCLWNSSGTLLTHAACTIPGSESYFSASINYFVASGTGIFIGVQTSDTGASGIFLHYNSAGSNPVDIGYNGTIPGNIANFVQHPNSQMGSYADYTPLATPNITSVSPGSGTSGTSLAIGGTSFAHATSVTINGAGASFSINSDTSITATVPSGASYGPGTITVTNAAGTSSGFSFYDGAAPSISSMSPNAGPVGTSTNLSGSGFQYASTVEWGSTGASFTINSDSSITATVPSVSNGSYTVTVINAAGSGAYNTFFVGAVPNITSATPDAAPKGTVITLGGSGFTYVTSAVVNGASASYSISSDTSMTVTVPSGATYGVGSIQVFNATGGSNAFTFTVGGIARGRRSGAWVVVPPQGRRSSAWTAGFQVQGRRSSAWVNTV